MSQGRKVDLEWINTHHLNSLKNPKNFVFYKSETPISEEITIKIEDWKFGKHSKDKSKGTSGALNGSLFFEI